MNLYKIEPAVTSYVCEIKRIRFKSKMLFLFGLVGKALPYMKD